MMRFFQADSTSHCAGTHCTPHWNDDLKKNFWFNFHFLMFLKVYKHVFTRVRLCSSKKNHDSITQIALMLIWILLEYRVNSAKNHVFGLPFENGPIFHFKNHDSILLICPITRISHCSILFNYFFEIIIPMRGDMSKFRTFCLTKSSRDVT